MEPFVNEENGKLAGIVSYFSIFGWLIAYFALYQNNKTSLASYQLRQTLLFHIVSMVIKFGVAFILGLVWMSTGFFSTLSLLDILYLALFIIWLIGLIGAISGQKRAIPLMGDTAQTMFPSI